MITKLFIWFALILYTTTGFPQTTIYFFPGQGSDKRIFDSLDINPSYACVYLEYNTPEKNLSFK